MKPIRFKLTIDDPHSHIVRVEMTVRGIEQEPHVDLCLPVWTPGSYLVREYSQFVQVLRAVDGKGQRRDVTKLDKACWRVDTASALEVTVFYEVYAHTLNVRYSHVESDHAFLHGPSLFLYPTHRLNDEVEVHLELPQDWTVHSSLTQPEGSIRYRVAANFDELFDAPILTGLDLDVVEFEAANTPHRFVFWGRGNYAADRIAADTKKIVEASAQIFGGTVPYDDFHFLTLLTHGDFGGLEHRDSTALMYPRHRFADASTPPDALDDAYLDFMGLVSHEHFHVWNVKRIHPQRLGPFDYQRENYTRDLWTVEGITSYYTNVSLLRAGVITPPKFLEMFGDQLHALHDTPGRKVCSLRDASFDTWIKLYRPHAHNKNSNVSYYLKGAIASLILDVVIRVDSHGAKSLDDVMRYLWTQFAGVVGYPEGGFQTIVEEAVGIDVAEFFDVFIRGTDDPDWDDWLENIGLTVEQHTDPTAPPFFGFDHSAGVIKSVWAGGPAESAGLHPGDRVIAIDRFDASDLNAALARTTPEQAVEVHLFRRGELLARTVKPSAPRPTRWEVKRREDATVDALNLLHQWLGA